ncbi:GrpB family protein [Microbacterium sp.]|uniref:GrpB family protein n=1 Tax=Microbacterium sp. TaxID=51671 RepID=UPI003F979EBF
MASDQRVTLVPSEHEHWARMAGEMAVLLSSYLPAATIEHIGSTAVPGLPAKPVVDLAVGMDAGGVERSAHELARRGFDLEGERAGHAWLSWPDRSDRTFVIHVFEFQGVEWKRRLRFRDILVSDAESRAKYLAVKQTAAATATGWGDYTRAKAAVVFSILDEIGPI